MKTLLMTYWSRFRSSFWFVPSIMACVAIGLAFSAVELDRTVDGGGLQFPGWAYSGGAEGASLLLGTVAGSMIAIAGTVFSMTLVALSLASSQLGPRLLRNFMRNTVNQVVLGTFVATFMYCLLVLRTIRRGSELGFVPHFSVSLGVLLAIVSVGVLIYFIHHISVSIQADQVVARVGKELNEGIERLFPGGAGTAGPPHPSVPLEECLPASFASEAWPLRALKDGYLQMIDDEALMELACKEELLLRLESRPGHYLTQGRAMAMVWPRDRVIPRLQEKINAAFVLGDQRTANQDIAFSFNQLVEMAVRALSPGINDHFTAIACVDRLESALCRLARCDMPLALRFDTHGNLRLVAPQTSFHGIVDLAFNQIRQSARSTPAVAVRLLDAIAQIASRVQREPDAACLQRHVEMIGRGARSAVPEADDLAVVEASAATAMQVLSAVLDPSGQGTGQHHDASAMPVNVGPTRPTRAERIPI
ncbi:DUF2254 domain-containing protein [Pseudomarimonas salicorniae]|uniref:DUF2254 domain-containing protein n=1 Tax=Pseudomarimonas salicorniae TaxID=2933270 RepID=A0ABT0GEY6_9GAMM|nr:DUF2254 domain-containing protein [Lysobacter sp. CAU 1642]MCK7593101.1 DUF2254 domain-containing protein [Lysobacter sp. CAU 1642]